MDYQERQTPSTYQPRIDDALARIVETTGGDADAARDALDELDDGESPWKYLNAHAVPQISELIDFDVLEERIPHSRGRTLLEGNLGRAFRDPPEIDYYPDEARECLEQGNFIGGEQLDYVALWDRGDRRSICHAHTSGFWILGEDPIDFVENTADELEASEE